MIHYAHTHHQTASCQSQDAASTGASGDKWCAAECDQRLTRDRAHYITVITQPPFLFAPTRRITPFETKTVSSLFTVLSEHPSFSAKSHRVHVGFSRMIANSFFSRSDNFIGSFIGSSCFNVPLICIVRFLSGWCSHNKRFLKKVSRNDVVA